MRVLFDHNVPAPLRRYLGRLEIHLAGELGWHALSNGELLLVAETEGFDLLLTCDQNLRYQQNMASRRVAILVLPSNSWRHLEPHIATIKRALDEMGQGGFRELILPRPPLARRPPPQRGTE